MKFTIEITDPKQLDGIAQARAAFNATQTDPAKKLGTDDLYVQMVASAAAASYAQRFDADTVEGLKNRLAIVEAENEALKAG